MREGKFQRAVGTNVSFSDCAVIGDHMLFYENNTRALLKMDLDTKETSFVADIIINKDRISGVDTMRLDGDNLYLWSKDGKYFITYSLQTKEYNYVETGCTGNPYRNFAAAIGSYHNYFYVFPQHSKQVLKIDKKKNSVETLDCGLYEEGILPAASREGYFSYGFAQRENEVWLLPRRAEYIICFFMDSETYQVYYLPGLTQACRHLMFSGDDIYLLGDLGTIFQWNIRDNTVKEWMQPDTFPKEYGRILKVNDRIYLLPEKGDQILQIEGNDMCPIQAPDGFGYSDGAFKEKYSRHVETDTMIYFAQLYENYALSIDKQTGDINWYAVKISPEFVMERNGFVYENTQITLPEFLSFVLKDKEPSDDKEKESIGADIWEKIKP